MCFFFNKKSTFVKEKVDDNEYASYVVDKIEDVIEPSKKEREKLVIQIQRVFWENDDFVEGAKNVLWAGGIGSLSTAMGWLIGPLPACVAGVSAVSVTSTYCGLTKKQIAWVILSAGIAILGLTIAYLTMPVSWWQVILRPISSFSKTAPAVEPAVKLTGKVIAGMLSFVAPPFWEL